MANDTSSALNMKKKTGDEDKSIELNFLWLAILLAPSIVMLARQSIVHYRLSKGYMPLSLPIIGIAVSLSLHVTVSWIIQLLADLRVLAASELKGMLREVDLIETLAAIQVAIMFFCFYCWVRELCFFENLFAHNQFGACDMH